MPYEDPSLYLHLPPLNQVTSMKCAKNATGMVRKLRELGGNRLSYAYATINITITMYQNNEETTQPK